MYAYALELGTDKVLMSFKTEDDGNNNKDHNVLLSTKQHSKNIKYRNTEQHSKHIIYNTKRSTL